MSSAARCAVDPHQHIDKAIDVAQQREVLKEAHAAVGLENLAEELADRPRPIEVVRQGLDDHRPTEHEIDHRVQAPADVVLDHPFTLGAPDCSVCVRSRAGRPTACAGSPSAVSIGLR